MSNEEERLWQVRPLLWSAINEAEEAGDGVERFEDIPEDEELLTVPAQNDDDNVAAADGSDPSQQAQTAGQSKASLDYDVSQR